MWFLWFEFILCSGVIVLFGTLLSKYGDIIAEKTGLGRAWIGLILMASVTSLPELITGISSVTIADTPDIALGDIMGSCVFNLFIIAIMDILQCPGPIFYRAEPGHILSAGFGIILIGMSSISILVNNHLPVIGHIGLYTPAIMLIYVIGMRGIFLFEKRKKAPSMDGMAQALQYKQITTREAVVKYISIAIVIIVAATWLPFIGDSLAKATGLGHSFIGTMFIATTTSLPELVVSIAALKIGAADMAIANIFGSNMFNIVILAVDDIFYIKGSLLSDISTNHAVTGLVAMLMTGIAVAGISYRLEKKTFLRIGWDAAAIFLACLLNIFLMYSLR